MHACMCACTYMCKCACMYLFASTCVFVCASVHTGLRAYMCALAWVHECRCARMRGWVHAHMREECACVVSDPASSPPWKPSVGLACMHSFCAPGAATSEPLAVDPLAAVGPSRIPFHEGHGCSIPQKQLLNISRIQCFGFLWSRRPLEGHFSTTHSDRIYTRIIWRILRRLKFT